MSSHVALSQDQARGVLPVLGPALTLCGRGENGVRVFLVSTLPRDRIFLNLLVSDRSRLCCRWHLDAPFTWNPHLKLARVGPGTASSVIVKRGQPTTARPSFLVHRLCSPACASLRPPSLLALFSLFGFCFIFFSLVLSLSLSLHSSPSLCFSRSRSSRKRLVIGV